MWILRFHLLEPKDYNKITRVCKKYGFSARKISPIVLSKASIRHLTQKISWRALALEFGVSHIALYQFYEHARKTELLREIFHIYRDRRIALYIGQKREVSIQDLENNEQLLLLTKQEIESMLLRL